MNVLDLFSGIGGFSLGLERAGMRTVAFCEIEPYARAVLRARWPGIPIYDDVRNLTADGLASDGVIAPDVICGGFPCQDLSIAGSGAGIDGARSGLWSEYARLIGEIRPKFVIVENVANLLAGPPERPGRWFGRVLGDLAEIGFDAEWHCIPASAIGAEHHRNRIWIVAYPSRPRSQGLYDAGWGEHLQPTASTLWRARRATPEVRGAPNGVPNWVDRIRTLGNSVVPQIPEAIGRAIMKARLPK